MKRVTGLLLLLAFAQEASAATTPAASVALSPPQQQLLHRTACGHSPGRDAVESAASRAARGPRTLTARVRCPLEAPAQGYRSYFQRNCVQGAERQWNCDAPLLGFRLPIGAREVLVTYLPELTPTAIAVEVAVYVALRHGYTFNGRNLSAMMTGECHLDRQGPGAFAGAMNYLISCGDGRIVVTRDCHREPCRVFPSAVFDISRQQ